MLINNDIYTSLIRRLIDRLPFAFWLAPGKRKPQIILPETGERNNNSWLQPLTPALLLNSFGNTCSYIPAVQAVGFASPSPAMMQPTRQSTRQLDFMANVVRFQSEMEALMDSEWPYNTETQRQLTPKAVLSQVKAVTSPRNPLDVALAFFADHPKTLRWMAYTHETGLWFGATPELLMDYEIPSRQLTTMALAGTMPANSRQPWDDKNIAEHEVVLAQILATLQKAGVTDECSTFDPVELRFGKIKHLCSVVEATLDHDIDPIDLLHKLSPTPALCGFPRDWAMPLISVSERHDRLLYGGYVGIAEPKRLTFFVNLRCAFAAPDAERPGNWLYNLYAGAGILPQSDPEAEWLETESKLASLLEKVGGDIL